MAREGRPLRGIPTALSPYAHPPRRGQGTDGDAQFVKVSFQQITPGGGGRDGRQFVKAQCPDYAQGRDSGIQLTV